MLDVQFLFLVKNMILYNVLYLSTSYFIFTLLNLDTD